MHTIYAVAFDAAWAGIAYLIAPTITTGLKPCAGVKWIFVVTNINIKQVMIDAQAHGFNRGLKQDDIYNILADRQLHYLY